MSDTHLINAVCLGDMERCIRILERFKASKDYVNRSGSDAKTALMTAAACGELCIAELLVKHGALINETNCFGWSPIVLASWRGHVEVVEFLLSNGADIKRIESYWKPNITDILNNWPISMAIIVLQELSLYYQMDASTIIDLHQYMGLFSIRSVE